MKITDTSNITGVAKSKKVKKSGGDSGVFDAFLDEAEAPASSSASEGASPASALESVGAFLGFQEVGDDAGQRQRSLKNGAKALDVLDNLRKDLLLGGDETAMLSRMKQQQQQLNAQSHDPAVQSVIDDIDLRLAVEIAKRETV